MPFHFRKSESPARGVRRICNERIRAALNSLCDDDRPSAIHCARKEIKKLRAIFRLVREEIGNAVYRKGARALREAAASLTAPRDAWTKLEAFEKLAGHRDKRFPEMGEALRKHCRREALRFQKKRSGALAARILRRTSRRVDGFQIKATGWAVIEPGLRDCYRLARSAHRLARREPSPEHFHKWRKQVKDLWCYLRLIHPAGRSKIRLMIDELESLGEFLGDDHDLFMLKKFVKEHFRRTEAAAALNHMIDARQKELRLAALKLGARLFAENASVFCRSLENYWEAWRGKS